MRELSKILYPILAALLFVACAGTEPQPEPVTIHIDMAEYSFEPAAIQLQVGQQATLELANNGQLDHEILIGRDVLRVNNRPAGYQTDFFETAGLQPEVSENAEVEQEEGGLAIIAAPGETITLTFPVTGEMAGQWEIGCFEQEGVHYDAGMKGTLTVQE